MPRAAIRILTILEAYSVTGPAKAVLEFAREARKAAEPRIELSVLTFVRSHSDNEFIRAVRAEDIPIDIVYERGRFDTGVFAQMRAAVARRKPHIIWTHGVKSHFLIRLSGLHKQARWVAFDHGYTTTSWSVRLYNQLDRWSHLGASRIVTVCRPFAARLESRGIDPRLIRVEHMPIRSSAGEAAPAGSELRNRLQIDEGATVLLSVGRLSREKGHSELLKAFASVLRNNPQIRLCLLLVGDGPEAIRLRRLSAELHLDNHVHFMGHQNSVRVFYDAADIFVLPSHSEGSPNVLLEAIDAGLPTIATAVGGIPEIVTNEASALLVPPGDVDALTAAISRLVTDKSLQDRLRKTAKVVLSHHSPERYFQNISAIFEEVIDNAGVGNRR